MPSLSPWQPFAFGREENVIPVMPTPDEVELQEDLQRLIAGQTAPEFRFQPIADLQRAVVAGYEALARLPVRAGLAPDVCLRAASKFGLRIPLERLLAEGALEARRRLPPNSFLCVNVSPSFLVSRAWEQTHAAIDDLSRVVIEITEEQCIDDYDSIRVRMAEIRRKGGLVAIDDAGAGYASLKHVLELRPSFIKLDRDFISHCDTDRAKSTLIEAMGVAAGRMDAWIIAEGVEATGELAELQRLGVPLAQGYLLGRPAPAMTGLQAEAQGNIRLRSLQRETRDHLPLLAEACPVAHSMAEAKGLLDGMAPGSLVAVVDAWARPVALVERHTLHGVRSLTEPLRCQISGDLQETLRRALTRSPETRFDPVVLTIRRAACVAWPAWTA